MRFTLSLGLAALLAVTAGATTIIQDNFDGYADQAAFNAVWTKTSTNAPTLASTVSDPNALAYSGTQSVKLLTPASTNTIGAYRNFPSEYQPTDAAPLVFECMMYYKSGATRHYNELRAYDGGGYLQGNLSQIVALGWTNALETGDPNFNGTKYQARVAFGSLGWENLNLTGAPDRSVGWHKFTVRVGASTVKFLVDDILGAELAVGYTGTFDSVVLGSRVTSAGFETYVDDVNITPEPAALALLAVGMLLRRR